MSVSIYPTSTSSTSTESSIVVFSWPLEFVLSLALSWEILFPVALLETGSLVTPAEAAPDSIAFVGVASLEDEFSEMR